MNDELLGFFLALVFLYILLMPVFIIGGWARIKDAQTKIDKAIENQEKLIGLLKEIHKPKLR